MGIIPEELIETIEAKRRGRRTAIRRAQEQVSRARARANSPPGGIMAGSGTRSGSGTSRTEKAALAVVQAEKNLEEILRWEEVFQQTDGIFPPASEEGRVAALIYDGRKTQEDACRLLHCDRQTVRRRRLTYLYRLALLATAAGLITPGEIQGNEGR